MEDYTRVLNYFGKEAQRRKLNEEVLELEDALFEGDRNKVLEELADVLNIITQFVLMYNINDNEMRIMMDNKLSRTINRIEKGYYEKERR